MLYGIKGQLTLKPQQKPLVAQSLGNTRFVRNQFLAMWNERYENNASLPTLTEYDLSNLLPTLKREYPFLKKSDSTSLQQISKELTQSFKNFFQNRSHFKHPRFKSKQHARQSYTSKNINHSIRLEGNYLRLPKLGWVQFRSGQTFTGNIKRATITLTSAGTYECSLLVDDESQVAIPKTHRSVGIDMGVSDLMVLSTGEKIPTIRFHQQLTTKRLY